MGQSPPAVAGRRRSHGRQGTHPKRQREREPRNSLADSQDQPAEDEQGLVAESAGPLGAPPPLPPVESDARGLRLRGGVQIPRRRGAEAGSRRANDEVAGLVAGGLW